MACSVSAPSDRTVPTRSLRCFVWLFFQSVLSFPDGIECQGQPDTLQVRPCKLTVAIPGIQYSLFLRVQADWFELLHPLLLKCAVLAQEPWQLPGCVSAAVFVIIANSNHSQYH